MTKTASNIHPLQLTLNNAAQHQFNGAAIIDEFGNEVLITETMVQRACNALKDSWHFPKMKSAKKTRIAKAR